MSSTADADITLARPPFDPELDAVLHELGENVPRLRTVDDITTLRAGTEGVHTATDAELSCNGFFEVSRKRVPGPSDAPDVELLICRPTEQTRPVPAFYTVHGGGMVMGDSRTGLLERALPWAREFGATVVSVEYRLAPEHPYPAGVDDCYAGLLWTAEHAAELGIDPDRLLIAGGSGGAALTAATTLRARDRGTPRLAGQLLMSPMLDDRNETRSALQYDGRGVWDRATNLVAWRAVLPHDCGGPDVSPYAAPARATDLSGLPPTYIDVGTAETFRDEAVAYAEAIWRDGGDAELHVWAGGFHGYESFAPRAAVSQDSVDARARWLRRQLAR